MLSIYNIFFFLISVIILYIIARLIIKLIDYLLFKKIIASAVHTIVDNATDKELNDTKIYNHDKDEEIKNDEKNQEEEIEVIVDNNDLNINENKKKIVGINIPIYGQWTQKRANEIQKELMQNINPEDIANGMGINEAKEVGRDKKRNQGIENLR